MNIGAHPAALTALKTTGQQYRGTPIIRAGVQIQGLEGDDDRCPGRADRCAVTNAGQRDREPVAAPALRHADKAP